jgi:hypothetical protein
VLQQDANGQWITRWNQAASASAGSAVVEVAQDQAGVVDTGLHYNAFGEVIKKGVNGGEQEYFDYDNAGRLWRSNGGDGVDKVMLHDTEGRATAEIRSTDLDLHGYRAAAEVAGQSAVRRTDIRYDALGRAEQQMQAERNGVRPTVNQQFDRWGNVVSVSDPRAAYIKTTYRYNANNQLVQESKPDADGAQGAGSSVTR